MSHNLTAETLNTIAALGFDVYQAPDPKWHSYAYFTDGTHIGYIQNDRLRGLSLSTVNIPCAECGTGFAVSDDRDPVTLTRECLSRAFAVAPNWASTRDRQAVRKYADMAAFLKTRGSYQALERVREGVKVASFEAIGWVRHQGALGEFSQKWLTVPTQDTGAAIAAFRALGYETRGVSVITQAEATALAE